MNAPLEAETEQVATQIVDACFKVHSALGPGLLESVYEVCLAHEFQKRGLAFERQKVLAVVYDGVQIESGLRLDFLVENRCIVEMKAIEEIAPIHQAQVLTYLKLTGIRLGLLVNFNVMRIKDGLKRIIL